MFYLILFAVIYLGFCNWIQIYYLLGNLLKPQNKLTTVDGKGLLKLLKKKTGLDLTIKVMNEQKKMIGFMVGSPPFKPVMIFSQRLYSAFDRDEFEWVALHESGHFLMWHNVKMVIIQLSIYLFGIWLLWGERFIPFVFAVLYAFMLGYFYIQIVKIIEFQADYFAVTHMENPRGMISGNIKMAKANEKLMGGNSFLRSLVIAVSPEDRIRMAEAESERRQIPNYRSAFTLIEVLIVIMLLSMIAPVAYFKISSYFAQGHDYLRKTDLKALEIAMEHYYDAANAYPLVLPPCGVPLTYNNKVIIDSIPCDPTAHTPYVYLTDSSEKYQWYKIYTNLERDIDKSIALIGCSDGCGPGCAYNYGVASPNISITTCILSGPGISPVPTATGTASSPTPGVSPTITPARPTLSPLPSPVKATANYVCAPGSGQSGSCEVFYDPDRSLCPVVYIDDPTCQNKCDSKDSRCKNSSGKYQ